MSSPTTVVRIDVSGTAFRGSPTWTDYTSSVMNDPGVALTWGRQDYQGDPPPRTCSFLLKNDTGAFTPGSATAPAGWGVGARVNVRVTVGATTYDRFDGYVDEIAATWPGGVQSWSVVRVTCTDITARLAAGVTLLSMLEQEMMADGATLLYPLTEAAPSTSAGDVAGSANPTAKRVDGKYGAGTLAFGADMGLPEGLTGIAVTRTPGANGTAKVSALVANGVDVRPTAGAAIEQWFTAPAATSSGWLLQIDGSFSTIGFTHSSTDLTFWVQDPVNGAITPLPGLLNPFDGQLHHLAGVLEADMRTLHFYVDGLLVDTAVAASACVFNSMTKLTIGASSGSSDPNVGVGFNGSLALVGVYETPLTAAQVLEHYQLGVEAFTEASGARYARLAGYGAVPTSGLPTGQATMGVQHTRGVSITEALQKVARTEGTVSYATGAGALTFQARNARYSPATLALTSADIDGDVTFRHDRQGFANEWTVSRDGGASQKVVNAASQAALGRFDGGSFEVAASSDFDALQNASWRLKLSCRDDPRVPSVSVNLLRANSTLAGQVLAADISTLVTVSGLPAQAPATSVSLFIEGGSEVIALNRWSVQFFTSPSYPFTTLRADGSASSRTKLDTGLVIPF